MASTIEDLHEAVFGFRPAKAGTAYERLTAVVLAIQGWERVTHDTTESAPGKFAEHHLDVTGRHPSGRVKRLIVECKHWGNIVGKGTLDKLVGVGAQLGADAAAVITTVGYTQGAINVAADENIGLWRLRLPNRYIQEIPFTMIAVSHTYSDIAIELMPYHELPSATEVQVPAGDDRLLHLDGSPAEAFREVLQGQHGTANDEAGPKQRRVSFSSGRRLPVGGGESVPIHALRWTETIHRNARTPVAKVRGEPALILERLNKDGEPESGGMVVDYDLFAWDIDADDNVVSREELPSGARLTK